MVPLGSLLEQGHKPSNSGLGAGEVVVDDALKVVDVEASGGNVGGYQDARGAAPERLQRLLPATLRDVPVDGPHALAKRGGRGRQGLA